MIPALAFIGHSGSGKTTLLAEVIRRLSERGYQVGSVKHAPHLDNVDSFDSDSAQHRAAGARRVLLYGEDASALFWSHGQEDPTDAVERLFQGCDVVLIEGFKHGSWPKVEVFRRGRDLRREPLAGEIDVVAVVTDDRVAIPDGVCLFSPRQPDVLVDFIEELLFRQAS